jgi:hypothetical protein
MVGTQMLQRLLQSITNALLVVIYCMMKTLNQVNKQNSYASVVFSVGGSHALTNYETSEARISSGAFALYQFIKINNNEILEMHLAPHIKCLFFVRF